MAIECCFVVARPDVQGELLKTEFAKYGTVTGFKFFEKDHKMALIQMETIDDAVMGLIVSRAEIFTVVVRLSPDLS